MHPGKHHVEHKLPEFGGGRGGAGLISGHARGRRGMVRAMILTLLDESPSHGYQLIERISAATGGDWQPRAGSVYPALQLLEDQGLVRAEESEGRRVFHLTDDGRAYVQEHREELTAAWASMTGSGNAPVRELRELMEQLREALRHVAHTGSDAQIQQTATLLAHTRRQIYRILAEDAANTADMGGPSGPLTSGARQ